MFKYARIIFFLVMMFFVNGGRGWSEDMEDRFISPDFNTTKDIFIDVKDVSLVNVLKILSKQSGLSFISSQDVADKKITLYLNKIPLNQALQMILDANGLAYEMQEDSNVFVVKSKPKVEKTKITKVYQLKYATVSSSKLNSTISISASSSGKTAAGISSGGLEEVIKDALSADGKVVEDVRTNSLIITDVSSQFDVIEDTISKLDVPIPQILIEVEMLDVSKSDADQLGITYGATPLTFQGGAIAENYPFSSRRPTSAGSSSSSSSGSGPFTSGSFSASGMTAALNFLTTNTDAKTLARPRILTLNNETAQIQISTDQAIDVVPSSTSSGTSGSTQTYSVDRYTTGVILKVTPQVNLLSREITMAVSPKVVDVILSQVQPPTNIGGTVYDPETRGSDSILKLKDGQSMVIGGLMTTQNNNTTTKLPFLGDLPMFGAAFRSKNTSKSERELVIFLTPHIIDDSNQSAIKADNHSNSLQSSMNLQEASNRAQEIMSSLDSYETKKY